MSCIHRSIREADEGRVRPELASGPVGPLQPDGRCLASPGLSGIIREKMETQ